MKVDLAVTGIGLLAATGLSSLECLHAVRCAQSGFALLALPDRARAWISGARIARWTPFGGVRHWEHLGAACAREAWDQAQRDDASLDRFAIGVILGAPHAARPGLVFPAPSLDVAGWVEGALGVRPAMVEVLRAGACSAQGALIRANALLGTGDVQACIIGAVDCQAQFRVTPLA